MDESDSVVEQEGGPDRFLDAVLVLGKDLEGLPSELVEAMRSVYFEPGQVIEKRYEVLQILGFGRSGIVYKVSDRHAEGEIKALKALLPTLVDDEAVWQGFVAEFDVIRGLEHPNIAGVYDCDGADQVKYVSMEYVEGKPLTCIVNDCEGPLPIQHVLDIVCQICNALSYAHERTIHGNLKPQNVMVQADGTVKLLDFAVAKLASSNCSAHLDELMETAHYRAPELVGNEASPDAGADIYSLGVILYEMLTGRALVGPVRLGVNEWNPDVPERLNALIEGMLHSDLEKRPSSIREVQRSLRKGNGKRRGRTVMFVAAVFVLLAVIAGGHRMVFSRRDRIVPPTTSRSATGPQNEAVVFERPGETTPTPTMREELGEPVDNAPEAAVPPQVPALPTVTAADAVEASIGADEQRVAAEDADAATFASQTYTLAMGEFQQAGQHQQANSFDDALAAYQSSRGLFAQAAEEADRARLEKAALERARENMTVAKSHAEKKQAATYAATGYARAEEKRLASETQQSSGEAISLCNEAERLYLLAYVEANEALARVAENETPEVATDEVVEDPETGAVARLTRVRVLKIYDNDVWFEYEGYRFFLTIELE